MYGCLFTLAPNLLITATKVGLYTLFWLYNRSFVLVIPKGKSFL